MRRNRSYPVLPGGKIRRSFMFTLDPDIGMQVQNWMETEGIPLNSEAEAVRYLLRMHFASTPDLGYLDVVRTRAYNETKKWVVDRLDTALREIRDVLKVSLKGTDSIEAINR